MAIPRTGIGQFLALTLVLILVVLHRADSGTVTSVTITFPNGDHVPNTTSTQIQCNYQPTSASIAGLQFKAQRDGEADNGFFTYQVSPTSSSSSGLFENRASFVSASAGNVLIDVGPVFMQDQSQISCFTNEGFLDITTSLQQLMTVTAPPTTPSLSFSPSANAIIDGTDLTITCQGYGGNPPGTIFILTKKTTDASYQHHTTTTTDATNGIRSASYVYTGIDATSHLMEVLCVLNNSAVVTPGESPNVTATLDIKYGPINTAIDLVDGNNLTTPVDINCTADANPNPTFSWGRIEGPTWFDIPYTGRVLQVPASTPNGSWVYECTASNTIGGTTYSDTAQTSFSVEGNCAIGTLQTSYTVTEYNTISLHCVTQGTERTQWYYGVSQLSEDCTRLQTPYSVVCDSPNRQYNLTFNATWTNKGVYTCSCFANTENIVVEVEVPIRSVVVTCIVESSGQSCSDQALVGTDMLIITANTSCTYPDPTFTWYKNQTELDVSTFDLLTTYSDCTGIQSGQRRSLQRFNVTWEALGSPSKLEVLVRRSRAASYLASVSFNTGLHAGFAAAKIIGLILGVACAVAGITVGVIGLKKTLSNNAVKPKPQQSEDTETGERENTDLTSVST